jgi:hypothetical protein
MFLLQPTVRAARRRRDPRPPRSIGESVLVAGDAGAQGPRPQRAAGPRRRLRAERRALSRISIENLDNQARDVRETRAAAFTGERGGRRRPGRRDTPVGAPAPGAPRRPSGVVAVVAGDGLAAIFRDFGVAAVVRAASRPTRAPASCSRRSGGRRPRDHRPAEQPERRPRRAPGRVDGRSPVVVVPTRNAAEGFAALLALDPSLDAAANAGR